MQHSWKSFDSAFCLLQLSKLKISFVAEDRASLYIRLLSWAITGKRNVGNLLVPRAMALSLLSQPISHLNPRNSWENNSCHPQGSLAFFLDELKSPLSLWTSYAGCIPRTPIKRNETGQITHDHKLKSEFFLPSGFQTFPFTK